MSDFIKYRNPANRRTRQQFLDALKSAGYNLVDETNRKGVVSIDAKTPDNSNGVFISGKDANERVIIAEDDLLWTSTFHVYGAEEVYASGNESRGTIQSNFAPLVNQDNQHVGTSKYHVYFEKRKVYQTKINEWETPDARFYIEDKNEVDYYESVEAIDYKIRPNSNTKILTYTDAESRVTFSVAYFPDGSVETKGVLVKDRKIYEGEQAVELLEQLIQEEQGKVKQAEFSKETSAAIRAIRAEMDFPTISDQSASEKE